MNHKILPIISILFLLSISLVISQETLTDLQFQTELERFKNTNDPAILSDNIQRLTPEQQQAMINEVNEDFWRNWESEGDQSKKQAVWEHLDESKRSEFMKKYGEEYGNVKMTGFDDNTRPGSDSVFGNSKTYFRGSDIELYNKQNPDNPITEVAYEKTENGHSLIMKKLDGSVTLNVGDDQRGYFFDPDTNQFVRLNSENIPDYKDSMSGKWNGQGDITIDSTSEKTKIKLNHPSIEGSSKFTSPDGSSLSTYQRGGESKQSTITFNEDGTISTLSNTYLSRDNHDFFTGENTKFFSSKDAFEKARETLGDQNILAYDPNAVGKDGKKGFLFMNQKGRTLYDDLLQTFESSIERGTFESAMGIKDIMGGDIESKYAKIALERVEGLNEKVQENLGTLQKLKAGEELEFAEHLFVLGLSNDLFQGQLELDSSSPLLGAISNNLEGYTEIGDTFSAIKEAGAITPELSTQLAGQLSTFSDKVRSTPLLGERYKQGFMQAELHGNIGELKINGGRAYNGDEIIIKGSPAGISIDKKTASTTNFGNFHSIGSITSDNGGNQFSISSQRGTPRITRTGSDTVTLGGSGLFGQVSREDGFFANLFEGGTQYSVGTVNTQVERAEYQELVKLYNSGTPEDKVKFYAKLADSDYAIDIDLNTYSSSGRVGQEAASKKAGKIYYEGLPALDSLSEKLKSSLGKPISLSETTGKATGEIIGNMVNIGAGAIASPGTSELQRSVSGLLTTGDSILEVRDNAVRETDRVVQFLKNSIISYGGDLRTIKYEGGSGLYQLTVNGNTHIIDPDLAPIVHTAMPSILDRLGGSSGNRVYDTSGSRVFHPGTWNVVATTSGIDPTVQGAVTDPRHIERIVNPSTPQTTQITQTPTTRTQTPTQTNQYRYNKRDSRYFGRTGQMRYKRERAKGWVQ